MIIGRIAYLGSSYKNGLERLEIWIDKRESKGLPNEYGKRVPITLSIRRERYTAGIRSTNDCEYIWICPNLIDSNHKKISLSQALKNSGYKRNDRVRLLVQKKHITIVSE